MDYTSDSHNFTFTGPKISFNPPQNPFENISILRLMNWFHNTTTSKTLNDLDTLVHEVILAPDFDINHLLNFRGSRESERLDKYCEESDSPFSGDSRWIETSINISVPCEKVKHASESDAPVFTVKNLFYRRPLEVIKSAYREAAAEHFNITPYKEYWQPSPDSPPERIFSEIYNSDAYIQEHEHIKAQPRMPGPQLETVIGAIMLSSDSTHLTSFGTASLWRTVHSPTFSARNSRNPPDSNPGMSWCDKGQISIFIPGGVWQSPLETSIFQRSPWNPSGIFPLSKSTGLRQNPLE